MINIFFLIDTMAVPKIDLVFAISSVATNAEKTFTKMKDTIRNIILEYGTDALQYGVIVFGDTPTTRLRLDERFNDISRLNRSISVYSRPRGIPSIKSALEEAKRLFEGRGARPDAKKILVVIIDKSSR